MTQLVAVRGWAPDWTHAAFYVAGWLTVVLWRAFAKWRRHNAMLAAQETKQVLDSISAMKQQPASPTFEFSNDGVNWSRAIPGGPGTKHMRYVRTSIVEDRMRDAIDQGVRDEVSVAWRHSDAAGTR